MLTLHTLRTLYRPLTSRPFLADSTYMEYAPCGALKPYIACFWGSDIPAADKEYKEVIENRQSVLVIPDTCLDIIIEINHTRQKVSGRLCGIMDHPFMVAQDKQCDHISSVAIRFYFWAVSLFLDLNMRDVYNEVLDLDLILPGCLCDFEALFYLPKQKDQIVWMEDYLLKRFHENRSNSNLYNSIYHILNNCGRTTVKEICEYSCISQRQMERLFQRDIGISVKRTANLVRYQKVWRELALHENFQIQEAVYRYGYADQSHLLNEFKKFHGVTLKEAKKIALSSQ